MFVNFNLLIGFIALTIMTWLFGLIVFNIMCLLIRLIIPPANFVCGGYTVFTLSVRPSVRP